MSLKIQNTSTNPALAEELAAVDWTGESKVELPSSKKDKQRVEDLMHLTHLQAEVIDYQDSQLSQEVTALKSQLLMTNWMIGAAIVMGLILWLL